MFGFKCTRALKISVFVGCYTLQSTVAESIRKGDSYSENHVMQNFAGDVQNCASPTPFMRRNIDLVDKYHANVRRIERKYKDTWAPGTFVESSELFSELEDAELVLWGTKYGASIEMSFFNNETFVEGESGHGGSGNVKWSFVPPHLKDFSNVKETISFEGDHVLFVGPRFDVFSHFLIDNIGYIAYLREIMPKTTRLLLADRLGRSRAHLEAIDAEFANRVDWIQCDTVVDCDRLVKINHGKLAVVVPISSTRHMDLLFKARKWFLEVHPPNMKLENKRTIIYYTRNSSNASMGRAMNDSQEQQILRIIERRMEMAQLGQQLVIFDGTEPLDYQIKLFQSADAVIGPHGGGLANLLFLLSADSCEARPKVFEFITSSKTPEVHEGIGLKSYYNVYSTCPWAEYYHIHFIPPSSDENGTYVDIGEFSDAIKHIFDNIKKSRALP